VHVQPLVRPLVHEKERTPIGASREVIRLKDMPLEFLGSPTFVLEALGWPTDPHMDVVRSPATRSQILLRPIVHQVESVRGRLRRACEVPNGVVARRAVEVCLFAISTQILSVMSVVQPI